jgi:hypothetical protein
MLCRGKVEGGPEYTLTYSNRQKIENRRSPTGGLGAHDKACFRREHACRDRNRPPRLGLASYLWKPVLSTGGR